MGSPPFLPYGRQTIEQDDIDAVVEVLRSDFLTTGPTVGRFESALATATDSEWAVAVSSGTAALHAACFAAGVGPGDRVVVPAISFLATANCARFLGAEPVFADVHPDTGLIDPASLEACLDESTRAVIPVHLNGAVADLTAVRRIADASNAVVIEDAAHALGAERDSQGGAMSIFSFHPVKHITTGEGGAITGDDPSQLERLRRFRNHGMVREPDALQSTSPGPWYYEQQLLGHNLRLSDLHAALGVSQLNKLDRFVARRRALARRYDHLFEGLASVRPVTASAIAASSAYHLYAVLIDFDAVGVSRRDVALRLRDRGVGTQVHYQPIVAQPYYRDRGWDVADFPGARSYYSRVLSLPLFPSMRDSDVDRVFEALAEALTP